MDPGDSSQSPGRAYFDTASLLGSPYGVPTSAAAAAAAAYAQFAHIPSAFSMLGVPHLPPGLVPQTSFGGLGSLGEISPGMRSQASLASSLSPTTGGAAWWRAASEQARLTAAAQQMCSAKMASTLNGAYSSMFQVPTLTTTSSTSIASSSSKTTSSSSKKELKSSSSSSSASSSREREREKDGRSPSTTKSDKQSDKAKEEEFVMFDPMKFASAMFPYGMPPASGAGASMYPPSLFSFPFGTPYSHMGMFPGMIPPGYPTSDPSMSIHSPTNTTTTSSGRSTSASSHPTTTTTTTSSSRSSNHRSASSSSSSSHRDSPSSTSSRKKLFSESTDTSADRSSSHQKDAASSDGAINFSTKKSDLPPVPKLTKIPVPSHLSSISSPKSKDDSHREGSVGSSMSDQSDGEHDETKKSHSSIGMSVPLKIPKRSASPEVQDLSMKKKRTSEPPASKSSSSARTDGHWSELSRSEKSKGENSQSSNDQFKSDLAKSEQQFLEQHLSELQLAHQLAASGYSELLAAHMPGKLSPHLFMHPAAAMMFSPGMLDGSGLLMPPPPPSSSSRRGGRGRGRGSRGGRGRRSASPVPNGTLGISEQPLRRSRGRGRRVVDTGNRSNKNVHEANRYKQQLAAQSQLSAQHEQLRAQLEAHLRTQQYFKAKEKHDQAQNKVGDSKLAQALMGQQTFPSKKGSQKVDAKAASQKADESDDLSSNSDSDSESNSDRDNDSVNSDSDGENSSQASDTASTPGKRPPSGSKGSPNKKKKHGVADEKELRIPLEHGWRRQVCIHSIGTRGFTGEIIYYASCGRKLKSYNEVLRYLQKNEITDLSKENFSFSMNVNVGEFLEAQPGKVSDDGVNGYVSLNETEVMERFLLVQQKKQAKQLAKQERALRRAEKKRQADEMSQRMAEARMQKKLEQQEMARKVAEMKVQRKMERQKARDSARQHKVTHAIEVKQMKEHQRLMKQQEKMQRQEQQRQEREMRAQQIIEMKQRKKQEEEQMRMMETLKRAKEREMKRQQAVYMKEQDVGLSSSLKSVDPHSIWKSFVAASSATCGSTPFTTSSASLSYSSLLPPYATQERERRRNMMVMVSLERERRRQHMLLVKALETRRKHEERERLKEEKKEERRRELEKKLEQRRQEEEKDRELRRPVEDMSLRELKDLPQLDRLKGLRLPGQAVADSLMVVEFLNNFKDALDMDGDTLPSLQDLQGALLDDDDYKGEFLSLTSLLLSMAIEDPGVPNNKESITESGQKITEMEISDENVSEILRIFMKCRMGKEDKLCKRLRETPLQCFVATHRAQVLAYLCNELLTNKAVTAEIEGHIETISNCRKERWIAENKIRKLKMIQIRKFKRSKMFNDGAHEESNAESTTTQKRKNMSDDEEEESGNESDVTNATAHSDGEEDETLNQEELEKKTEKMQKQFDSYGTKAFNTGHKLRATDFGQDRFRRRYWVLPHCGGIFVEGLESAEPEEEPIQAELEKNAPAEEPMSPQNKENNDAENKETKDSESNKENCDITDQEIRQLDSNLKSNQPKNSQDNIAVNNPSSCQTEAVKSQDDMTLKSDLDLSQGQSQENDKDLTKEEPMETNESKMLQNGENLSIKDNENPKTDCKDNVENGSNNDVVVKSKGLQNGVHVKEEVVKDEQLPLKEEPITPKKEKEEVLNGSLRSDLSHSESLFRKVDQFFERDLLTRKDGLKKEELLNGTHDEKDLKCLQGLNSPLTSRPDTKYTDLIISLSKQVPVSDSPNRSILDSSGLKMKTESPSSFRSIESMIDNTSTPNSHITSTPTSSAPCSLLTGISPVPGGQVTAEQMLRTLSSRSQGSWFSVLPRVPCDSDSVTTCHNQSQHQHSQSEMDSSLQQRWYANSPASFMSASFNECSQMSSRASTPFNSTIKSEYSRCDTPTAVLDETMFQRKLEAKQFKEPKPIPKTMRRGWWRIPESERMKNLSESLHPRGIRERMLLRKLETMTDFAHSSCGKGSKDATEIEETEESDEVEKSDLGVAEMDDLVTTDKEAVHEINLLMLKHVEALQERMINASLQVKVEGCPSLTKATEDDSIDLVSDEVPDEESRRRNILDTAKEMLLLLESNIERRYLKPPFSKGIQVNLANMNSSSSRASPGPDEDDEDDADDAPPALLRWRGAVARAVNASQLCLYATQLEENIAWEKSIMKVACQICSKDDNEAQLLLCDSCDKGYHTYCFKPRMENIPDGDWFCFECIAKATNDFCCVKCGKKVGKLVTCNKCPRKMHLDCLDPPLPRMPRRWTCLMCTLEKGKGRGRKKSISKSEDKGNSKDGKTDGETSDATPHPTPEKKHKSKHEEIKAEQIRGLSADPSDLTVCSLLLAEMEKHSDSWPFLKSVNTKQFPSYRKYIKQPMDFHSMHIKLRDNIYKLRSEFASDARLVFNNCQTFNEDDSEVGISGHSMRKFFEKRWKDFGGNGDMSMLKNNPTSSSSTP